MLQEELKIWFIDKQWHEECQSFAQVFSNYGDTEDKMTEVSVKYSEYRQAARDYSDASFKYNRRDVNEEYLLEKQKNYEEIRKSFISWLESIAN